MADMLSIKQLNEGKLNRDGTNIVTGSIDFDHKPVVRFVVQKGPALPGTGQSGQLFMVNVGTPGLYYHDGVSWVLIGGSGLSGTQFSASSIAPTSAYASHKMPLGIASSYPFASFGFLSTPANHAAVGASVGELGYEQLLSLRQKTNFRITGDHNVHVDLRIGELVSAAGLGPETYTENAVLPGSGSTVVIEHGLNDVDHIVVVGVDQFNDQLSNAELADVGQVWLEIGANQDIVYNTGAGGVKFGYMASISPLVYEPNLIPNGMAGVPFTHNLGTADHLIMIQPIAEGGSITEEDAASVGAYWSVLGANEDMIYCTGGTLPAELKFRCLAMQTI